jgi:hypothetical protein
MARRSRLAVVFTDVVALDASTDADKNLAGWREELVIESLRELVLLIAV